LDKVPLSRIEDACINASAPPQQRWVDGWLVRYAPGKARRARCVHALAEGRMALDDRLQVAQQIFDAAGLPMVFRITPMTCPEALDDALEDRGFERQDETLVMSCRLPNPCIQPALPPGTCILPLDPVRVARVLAEFRGSSPSQEAGHLQRLLASPVPYRAWAIERIDDGHVLACGQSAQEGEVVGVYDVHTDTRQRNQGLAKALCAQLLANAATQGASLAYLQVESTNQPALRAYESLGFVSAYRYHYRQRP
jgi:ribosomal protein S18 acetylase RimI-like enzyme